MMMNTLQSDLYKASMKTSFYKISLNLFMKRKTILLHFYIYTRPPSYLLCLSSVSHTTPLPLLSCDVYHFILPFPYSNGFLSVKSSTTNTYNSDTQIISFLIMILTHYTNDQLPYNEIPWYTMTCFPIMIVA